MESQKMPFLAVVRGHASYLRVTQISDLRFRELRTIYLYTSANPIILQASLLSYIEKFALPFQHDVYDGVRPQEMAFSGTPSIIKPILVE